MTLFEYLGIIALIMVGTMIVVPIVAYAVAKMAAFGFYRGKELHEEYKRRKSTPMPSELED